MCVYIYIYIFSNFKVLTGIRSTQEKIKVLWYFFKKKGVTVLKRSLGNLPLRNDLQKASVRPYTEVWFRRMSRHHLAKDSQVSIGGRVVPLSR